MTVEAKKETLSFQTEVKQLLNLMIHSLYSNREIFLRELISNASDACDKLRFSALTDASLMEDDGDLWVEVDFNKKAKTITVRDNGIGIDERFHDKVFGLFDQLDQAAEGSGVGLSLVKRIVEVHGGHIWVESAGQEQGSTFYFTLPNEPAD